MRQFVLLGLGLGLSLVSAQSLPRRTPKPLAVNQWIDQQTQASTQKLIQNISPEDGAPGSVIASPERVSPNYYYHWNRDSALTYLTVLHLYRNSHGDQKKLFKQKMIEFADFSAKLQNTSALGEPKFYLDGRVFDGAWCRPQNDGPALRAVTLLAIARELKANGESALADQHLLPVIRRDIDFVKNIWRQSNCDLWEEVYGDHFYTRMVQRRALIEAAKDAAWLGEDAGALKAEADLIGADLQKFWDGGRNYFVSTLNRTGGIDYKNSNLDASVILAALHGHTDDGFIKYTDPRMLATAEKLIQTFHALYPINQAKDTVGTAIGRYPEDRYAGANFDGGNPWVLLTAALSQYYYRVANEFTAQGNERDASIAFFKAEDLLRRVQYHAPADGALAEQMDRQSGYMTSARDLTWSHAEVLEMFLARSADHPGTRE